MILTFGHRLSDSSNRISGYPTLSAADRRHGRGDAEQGVSGTQNLGGFDLDRRGKAHGRLEGVATGVARPEVPQAAAVEEFRPFRQEKAFATLRAFDERVRTSETTSDAKIAGKFHGAASSRWTCRPGRRAGVTP